MKRLLQLAAIAWALGGGDRAANAAFSSLYVFGDGVSTTTNAPGGAYYYGHRFTNGRVWVEVLAQRQGLPFNPTNNWSYFGHYSPDLVTDVAHFPTPPDAGTALFVIWVINADFVGHLADSAYSPYTTNNLAIWNSAINQSLSNHLQAVKTLYNKGARTFVMPNAVDVTEVPYYVGLPAADRAFLRQRVIDFNARFATLFSQAGATLPGITVYVPDFFSVLDHVLANPGSYGLVNTLENGRSIDALSDTSLTDKSLTGPGANYIFWDYLDPTARAHEVIADVAQALITPSRIGSITPGAGGNNLELIDLPVGLAGVVEGSPDFTNWTLDTNIPSSNPIQSITLPETAAARFYRLRFPFAWTWP